MEGAFHLSGPGARFLPVCLRVTDNCSFTVLPCFPCHSNTTPHSAVTAAAEEEEDDDDEEGGEEKGAAHV